MNPSTLQKIKKEAIDANLTFFKELKGFKNLYKFNICGHLKEIQPSKVRNGQFFCDICFLEKIKKEAEDCNLTLLKIEKGKYNLYKCNICGHEKKFLLNHIRNKSFKCENCIINKEINDAKKNNLTLLSKGKGVKNLYLCNKCNNQQEINKYHVSTGTFCCHFCQPSYATKKSGIYLIRIINELTGFSWLKLGVARNLKRRFSDYKLENSKIDIILYQEFETNIEAISIEKNIHRKINNFKISSDIMKKHMKSGFSECYPLSCEDMILNKINSFM